MPNRIRGLAASVWIAGALALAGAACARDSNAQNPGESVAVERDDTTSVVWLLNAVRGVDPLLCELATRSVDMHGSWSQWGPMGNDPLETDSAAAALIKWIQRTHNDPSLVPRLRTAMRDPDACVRRVGGAFLGRVEHPSATDALLTGLDDASAETRYVATIGLGLSEKPVALQPLIKRLSDDSPAVRRAAAWALGSLHDGAALDPLVAALAKDPDARVRQAAAWAIGEIHQ